MEKLFSDCSRFIYHKYKDKIGQGLGDGDLSESENDSQFDNSYNDNSMALGSFKHSKGHKAGRLDRNRHNKK